MGLEPVLTPNLPNRAVAHALRFRQAATTPMGARGRPRGQGRIDDGLHFRRTELLPSARPRGLTEHPRHPVGDKPPCPQPHGHLTDVQRPRDGRGRFLVRQHPHQPRPTRNLLGRRPLAGHPGQLGLLGRRCEDTVPLNEHAPPYQTVAQSTALCVQLFRTQDTSPDQRGHRRGSRCGLEPTARGWRHDPCHAGCADDPTIKATDGTWSAGPLTMAQSGYITFDAAGTYTYHCEEHP